MHDISVVICAYTEERWADLIAAIASVLDQSLPAKEVIIAIDHNPILFNRLKNHFPQLLVIENTYAQGAGGSRNSGVAVATGEIIAFLDDDAIAEPDWLENLVGGFNDDNVLGIGGSIRPLWATTRPLWCPEEFFWVFGCDYRGMPTTTAPMRNLIAANMAVRRSVFQSVGGFRSGFGKIGNRMGCDETELCIRINQQSTKGIWLYEPSAKVYHRVPEKRANWKYYLTRCHDEGHAKAMLSKLLGSSDSLSSERNYTLKVLPQGVIRGLGEYATKGDKYGLARSGFIISGFSLTFIGYMVGSIKPFQANFRQLKNTFFNLNKPQQGKVL